MPTAANAAADLQLNRRRKAAAGSFFSTLFDTFRQNKEHRLSAPEKFLDKLGKKHPHKFQNTMKAREKYEDLIDQLRGFSTFFDTFRHFSTNTTPREKGGFYETNRKRLQRILLFDRGRLDLQRTKPAISKRQGWILQAAQI